MVKNRWLISPITDMLLVGGILPWIFGGLLGYLSLQNRELNPIAGNANNALSYLFITASLLIGESHQFTSIIRLAQHVTQKEWLKENIIKIGALVLLLILAFTCALIQAPGNTALELTNFGLVAIVSIFPLVLVHHICIQAKAIGLIYCSKQDYKLTEDESTILAVSCFLLVAAGAVNIAAPLEMGSGVANSIWNVSSVFKKLINTAALLSVLTFAFFVVNRGEKRGEWLPLGAGLMWTNLAIWILLPLKELQLVWLFVPLFYHATQHWVIAWITHNAENQPSSASFCDKLFNLVAPVLVFSLTVLFLPTLFLGFSGTLGAAFSIIVFYVHYIADGIVWRSKQVRTQKASLNYDRVQVCPLTFTTWRSGNTLGP
ncbi:MAG: hypothetical protein K2X77_10325 [Candidatus Obscuribacterales bacterium]|jgi:hypothetical protein|nr:hypothetical protein [Candidatus Obscuribacterales bacterium]